MQHQIDEFPAIGLLIWGTWVYGILNVSESTDFFDRFKTTAKIGLDVTRFNWHVYRLIFDDNCFGFPANLGLDVQ